MVTTYTWGRWEEDWPDGHFRCVFVQTHPQPDGLIHAAGLYRAADGDALCDLDTFRSEIAERSVVLADGKGGLVIRAEFAELLMALPALLQGLAEGLDEIGHGAHADADSRWHEASAVVPAPPMAARAAQAPAT